MSPWVYLALAIVSEVSGTLALRYSNGFTRPLPVVVVVAGYVLAFYMLSVVTRHLALTTVYAVWSGAGIALLALVGFTVLDETMPPLKIASLLLIVGGIVGLNLSGAAR